MNPFTINKTIAIKLILLSLPVVIMLIIIWNIIIDRVTGGIIYKKNEDHSISYLLITTKNSKKWIFPKGKVKFFEFEKQAAIREIVEEAGVNIKIKYKLEGGPFIYQKSSGKLQNIELYAMEYLNDAQIWEDKLKRSRRWMKFNEAKIVLSLEFIRALEEVNNRLGPLNVTSQ